MPIFEYQCKECSTKFEELVLGSKRPDPDCPDCHSSQVEKVYSTFAAQSNGAPSESFSESAPMCGRCGEPGPCSMN